MTQDEQAERAITKLEQSLTTEKDLFRGLGNLGSQGQVYDASPILKMDKSGEWAFGVDNDKLAEGEVVIIDATSIMHGHIGWYREEYVDKKTGETKKRIVQGLQPVLNLVPLLKDLPKKPRDLHPDDDENEEGYFLQYSPGWSFKGVIYSGEYAGGLVKYQANSGGAWQAYLYVYHEIARRIAEVERLQAEGSDVPEELYDVHPVVELGSSSYKNKNHGGITFKPKFEIIGWTNGDRTRGLPDNEAPLAVKAKVLNEEPEGEIVEDDEVPEETKPAPKRGRRPRRSTVN